MDAIQTAFGHDTALCDRILAAASKSIHSLVNEYEEAAAEYLYTASGDRLHGQFRL